MKRGSSLISASSHPLPKTRLQYQRMPWGGGKRRGWKTSPMTPLPKKGFWTPPPTVRFPPPRVSVLCFSCTKIHDRADQKLFWRGPKIFGRARSLVRLPPPPPTFCTPPYHRPRICCVARQINVGSAVDFELRTVTRLTGDHPRVMGAKTTSSFRKSGKRKAHAIKKNPRDTGRVSLGHRAGQTGVYRPVSQGVPVVSVRKTDRKRAFCRDAGRGFQKI